MGRFRYRPYVTNQHGENLFLLKSDYLICVKQSSATPNGAGLGMVRSVRDFHWEAQCSRAQNDTPVLQFALCFWHRECPT